MANIIEGSPLHTFSVNTSQAGMKVVVPSYDIHT